MFPELTKAVRFILTVCLRHPHVGLQLIILSLDYEDLKLAFDPSDRQLIKIFYLN